jgi:hypothetical protein
MRGCMVTRGADAQSFDIDLKGMVAAERRFPQ